ncbi:hypothetical protein ABB37_08405 [Leptomonas pyrrhocoris]|uniref:Uncharacterized protein n=1 Tax=Leptomonas pyrrhocoris TaxID=157538 RepID=A0A0N1J4D5_LEPPY|nr:hypothetical protein ABB37_08405 [Leptomonas pyrrhocoris]KPA75508.1 hypothetical protein ABB37_08405 [Leptomonas pyrrhocoris]|eukprot:XP_015653947.1 hypothetical protein ABB37_08405 [Leptomonas pyrrhocoris]
MNALRRRTLTYADVAALLLLVLLLGCATLPTYAFIYATTLTATQVPDAYTGRDPTLGLFTACQNANNPNASAEGRTALFVLAPSMTELLAEVVTAGQVYLAGFYNASTSSWYWNGVGDAASAVVFATGPTAQPVNSIVAANWAAGYPKTGADGTVRSLKYVAYDASLHGWINVDGTSVMDGVACQSTNVVPDDCGRRKKFPWWAILIIVLGCVAVVAVVLTVVLCCCCKKKQRYTDDEDADNDLRRRGGSFRTQSTSFAGSSRTGSFSRSSSFSRGSSFSGSSKGSSVTGSSASSSVGSSSFSTQLTTYSGDAQSSSSQASSASSHSR